MREIKREDKKVLKQNSTIEYTSEMIFANLEAIIRQMLLVWVKESLALSTISGKKCGNYRKCLNQHAAR